MISKPILFSGPMVRAILEGRKTQTRRVVADANSQGNWKPSECDLSSAFVDPGPSPAGNPGPYLKALVTSEALKAHGWREDDEIRDRIYPRIFPGDQLWVRETWTQDGRGGQMANGEDAVYYLADMPDPAPWKGYWKPSIFMPRWASRLTLTVKDARVERLQDISEEDAKAEGVPVQERSTVPGEERRACVHCNGHRDVHIGSARVCPQSHGEIYSTLSYRGGYSRLWESINGHGSWDANPWVWVYTFAKAGGRDAR